MSGELTSDIDDLFGVNANVQDLLEGAQIATVVLDRTMAVRSHTPLAAETFGIGAADHGATITDIDHRLEYEGLREDIQTVLDTLAPIERSVRLRDAENCYLMRILPWRSHQGALDGALLTMVDVSRAVAAEEKQRVLAAELNHRVRNMLQIVIGLCNQTLHRSQTLKEFEAAFMSRMQGLARVYELLSRAGWRNVSLEDLIRALLESHADERCVISGERVNLSAKAALSLGLVLHELVANAKRHGALSSPTGRVSVDWGVGGNGEIALHWIESGGPRTPSEHHEGLGFELLSRQLRYELRGGASVEFLPEGLRITLVAPASAVISAES